MTRARLMAGRTFRSLHVRNYRLFFWGQMVSLTGTWMQIVAQGWLVLKLTGSGLALGITAALQFLPMLLVGVWGGLVADRFDKRRVLLVTQAMAAMLALALFALVATDVVRLWMIYALALGLGMVTVVDNPTRQAFVTEMVGPDEVPNAVALNSAVFNAARLVGPAVAGLLIRSVGIAPAFLLNGISFLAVLTGLAVMRPHELFRIDLAPRAKGQVREGLRYVWRSPDLRSTLLLVTVVATFGMNFNVVLPLLARFTFSGGAGLYGLLSSVMAVGSIAGALGTATSRSGPSQGRLVGAAAAFGISSLAAAAAPTAAVEAVLLVPVGLTLIVFVATANATLQLRSDPAMRGRVMALYALVFLGTTPLGSPIVGWLSDPRHLGPRAGLAVSGGLTALAAAVAVSRWRRSRADQDLYPSETSTLAAHPTG